MDEFIVDLEKIGKIEKNIIIVLKRNKKQEKINKNLYTNRKKINK